MFNHILAIDVADKIKNFDSLTHKFARKISLASSANNASSMDIKDAEGLIVSIYEPVDQSFLKLIKNLKHIFVFGTSTKKIDLSYCQENRIKIYPINDYCDHETAEWVIMKILSHFRQGSQHKSVYGKNLGVIGLGSIGKIVLKLGHALGMKLFYNSTKLNEQLKDIATFIDKNALLQTCDIVSIHTPPNTQWFTIDLFAHAKKNLCIINTAMGTIDNNNNLCDALASRPDISLIMDSIAGSNYQHFGNRVIITQDAAFLTDDVEHRLIEKLFDNIKLAL
jgi:lactate dehydrogenase-like 2-hydroxyacid dehydrogenase